MTTETKSGNPMWLIGKFFHSFEPPGRNVKWPGQVKEYLGDGDYVVELFNWVTGLDITTKIIPRSAMYSWCFYDNAEKMGAAIHARV